MLLEQQRLASRRIQTIMACLLADEDICRCWSRQLRLNCTLMMLREKFDSLGRLSRSMEGDGASSFSFNSLPASNEAKGTPHALPTRERQKFWWKIRFAAHLHDLILIEGKPKKRSGFGRLLSSQMVPSWRNWLHNLRHKCRFQGCSLSLKEDYWLNHLFLSPIHQNLLFYCLMFLLYRSSFYIFIPSTNAEEQFCSIIVHWNLFLCLWLWVHNPRNRINWLTVS